MSKHRPLWESSDVFSSSLSEKPTHSEADCTDQSAGDCSKPPPTKRPALDRPEASSTEAADETSSSPTDQRSADTARGYGPGSLGITYELCAGIVDKRASLEQIAREEMLEETSYDVPLEGIERVNSYYSSIGTAGTLQTLFYCEVTDAMMVGEGGGNRQEGELIEVEYISLEESEQFLFDTSKPKSVGLCSAFHWFYCAKKLAMNL